MVTSIAVPYFNKNWVTPYTKTFIKNVTNTQKKAIRAFIRATVPLVPVLTGTAVGSLQALAAKAGISFTIVGIDEIRAGRGPGSSVVSPKFGYYGGGIWVFDFQHTVLWYDMWDTPGFPPPGNPSKAQVTPPWESVRAGFKAYDAYLDEHLRDVPKVFDFMIKRA